MEIFKPSIISYASVSDCKMILDELKHDLMAIIDNEEQMNLLVKVLDDKKEEVEDRYNNR